MDFENFASSDFLSRLKCELCENHLSYFPIFVTPHMKNLCGRCYLTPRHDERIRNEVYETVSQFLKFPCRYKNNGCCEEFLPKDMPEHEETCPNKPIKCPSKCSWKGPSTNLLQHYQNTHQDLMLINAEKFEMNLTVCPQQENFLEYNDVLFTSSRKYDSRTNILKWAVYQTATKNNVESFSCEISVTNNKRKISVEINTTNSCEVNYIAISLDCLKEELEDLSVVSGKIGFKGSSDAKLAEIRESLIDIVMTAKNEGLNAKMLSAIKCFMCSHYITPPIFECLKEEAAFCLNCHNKHVRKCEFCDERAAINNSNICLDKMALCLNYPCRYLSYGCTFVAKHDEVTKHHEHCPHKKHLCPVREFVRCKWRGLLDEVSSHLECCHEDMVGIAGKISSYWSPKENEDKSTDLIDNPVECDLIVVEERFFRLTYTREDSAYYFEVQMVDNFEKPAYYEIEISDNGPSGKKILLMGKPCPPLSRKALLFSNNDQCCFFTFDQVASILSSWNKDMITFNVNIFSSEK